MLSYHDLSVNKFESRQKPSWDYRPYMPWIFCASGFVNVILTIRYIRIPLSRYHAFPPYDFPLFMPAFAIASVVVFGLAAWTSWRQSGAAANWGLAGSFLYFLTFARPFILHQHVIWYLHWSPLAAGLMGLSVYLWPRKQTPAAAD